MNNPLGLPWRLDAEAANGVGGCRTIEDCNGVAIANTHGLADDDEDRTIAEHLLNSANNIAAVQSAADSHLRTIEQQSKLIAALTITDPLVLRARVTSYLDTLHAPDKFQRAMVELSEFLAWAEVHTPRSSPPHGPVS